MEHKIKTVTLSKASPMGEVGGGFKSSPLRGDRRGAL